MKKQILILLLPLLSALAIASAPQTSLVIWSKDGTKVAYALMEKPKISFTATDLVMTCNDIEVTYELKNLARFTYEKYTSTEISDLKTNKTSFNFNGETLLFPSLKAPSTVSIYSTDGKLLLKKRIIQDGDYSFSISNLNSGMYIVDVDGLTYKIMRK